MWIGSHWKLDRGLALSSNSVRGAGPHHYVDGDLVASCGCLNNIRIHTPVDWTWKKFDMGLCNESKCLDGAVVRHAPIATHLREICKLHDAGPLEGHANDEVAKAFAPRLRLVPTESMMVQVCLRSASSHV